MSRNQSAIRILFYVIAIAIFIVVFVTLLQACAVPPDGYVTTSNAPNVVRVPFQQDGNVCYVYGGNMQCLKIGQ